MRRADRLLQIVQILRRESKPVSAQAIAKELEVTQRTIYRDMVAMESIRVPVRGEAGVGYMLEDGYDLPPLIFNTDELEALMLGARFVEMNGDPDQAKAAKNMTAKIGAVLPQKLREEFFIISLYAPPRQQPDENVKVDTSALRQALRSRNVLDIRYKDEAGAVTCRSIWPIAIGYFDTTRILAAWCEARQDYRTFRADRIEKLDIKSRKIPRPHALLMKEWQTRNLARSNNY